MTVGLDVEHLIPDHVAELVREWVRPDEGRVSYRVFSDAAIFSAEIERIWKRTWLWAGHESEVPTPGDYVCRTVGTVPIIISRTADGSIAVNRNVCAHRGNQVCHLESGNALFFKCPYHGWTYKNSGELVGIPVPKAYGERTDVKRLRLPSPKTANYRGLVFVSYSEDVPSIEDYLGTIRPELDRIFDLSPIGKLRFDVGRNSMTLDCNWKVFQEAGSDNYHTNFTHASIFFTEEQRQWAAAIPRDGSLAVLSLHEHGHTEQDFRPQERAIGNRIHTGNAAAPSATETQHFNDLTAAVGEKEAKRAFQDGPPLLYIYPSLLIIQQDLRRVEPVSPGTSLLFQHPAMLEGVPDEVNFQRLSRHEAAYGPAGFVVPDDMEMWGRAQRTMNANPDGWTTLTRGIDREQIAANGVIYSEITDETGMRGGWREYLKFMTKP